MGRLDYTWHLSTTPFAHYSSHYCSHKGSHNWNRNQCLTYECTNNGRSDSSSSLDNKAGELGEFLGISAESIGEDSVEGFGNGSSSYHETNNRKCVHDLFNWFWENCSFGKILEELWGLCVSFHQIQAPSNNSIEIGEIGKRNTVKKQVYNQVAAFPLFVDSELSLLKVLPSHLPR